MAGSCLEDVNVIINSISHRYQYESLKKVMLNFIDGRMSLHAFQLGLERVFVLFCCQVSMMFYTTDLMITAYLLW